MIFIDNKYTRIYNKIIERAKSRPDPKTYTERHHIIPRSLGGSNAKSNIAVLTAREHFICHWLLPKMTEGRARHSMSNALRMMMAKHPDGRHDERYIPNSKIYELVKKTANKASLGKPCSPETREKIRQGNLNRKPASEETRRKLSEAAKRRKGFTPEGRARVAEANKSRVWTNEMREKLRQHNLGKPNTAQKGIPQPQISCPHCGKTGGNSVMKRWHMDNCKLNTL